MKILVIQLARLGDIYTTWPILRALRRKYPDGRIDLLVRKRFSEACLGLDCVDQVHVLESDQVLEPLFKQQPENWWIESSSRLRTFTERISQNNYDRVINLSFSPFSSFLTKMVCSENSDVAGYSRYADGSFSVSDSMSGYFYSQVGIGRYNRIHLFDLFAMVSGVNLVPEDWSRPTYLVEKKPEKKIIVHIGASLTNKTVQRDSWIKILHGLQSTLPHEIRLVGANSEAALAQGIIEYLPREGVINLVGKTSLQELFHEIHSAALVIGADSSPMHIAALTQTPCLNISFESVNFWETGPRSKDSRILFFKDRGQIDTDLIVGEAKLLLDGNPTKSAVVQSSGPENFYEVTSRLENDFEWFLILALYFQEEFPRTNSSLFLNAVERIGEMSRVAQEQIKQIESHPELSAPYSIIQRLDEVLEKVGELVPSAGIITRWFALQKINIAPGNASDIILNTKLAYKRLDDCVAFYTSHKDVLNEKLR